MFITATKLAVNIVMEIALRTMVTLDEALVREFLELTKTQTKTAAVALAVKEQTK